MTTTQTAPAAGRAPAAAPAQVSVLSALAGASWRNNLRLSRNAASLSSAFIIPGTFFLVFFATFGHAARQAGLDYPLFLLAAALFQAVMFTAGGSAMALAVDQENGLIQRMRAMPLPAVAAVGGRLACDGLRAVASMATVTALALVAGARPHSVAGLFFALIMTLGFGLVLDLLFNGMALRSRHPIRVAALIQGIEMPVLMLSTAFVPAATLPDWVRPVIEHLPFSVLIDTERALLFGTDAGSAAYESLAWLIGSTLLGTLWIARSFRRGS
ncbi:MAG: ABC transporter permease [Actinomycetaceae bacterium]|nr:ABC transporter permease [Actinomycetaceae bacterium]